MVWCSYCARDQPAERDDINGFTCCTGCGRVLDDNVYSSEPTFCKSASGQSQLVGNFVRGAQYSSYSRLGSDPGYQSSASHERTLEKGRNEIRDIADSLSISGREEIVGAAHRLYVLAVEKSFTKGRRTQQVAAACLYIVCRQDNKPYLLIDFSDSLQINVYVLGAVFLQLCRLLRLEQHPMLQKPVDPSLFIHRFTDQLLTIVSGADNNKHHPVANTALRIVASMKRDWIQTGRKPSGICGAALFIAAQIHGLECTKTDVVSVVHVCENTLTKRLFEFGSTESGSLTPDEFEAKAREMEQQRQSIAEPCINVDKDGKTAIAEVLCEHKDIGAVHFAHGLCRRCYDEFIKVSGGIDGGSEPPAFQRAEKKRLDARRRFEEAEANGRVPEDDELLSSYLNQSRSDLDLNKLATSFEQQLGGASTSPDSCITEPSGRSPSKGEPEGLAEDADGTLSDIDDEEVTAYINNDEEVKLKTIIWTEMNKDYIEELEAKEAATAAAEAAAAAALKIVPGEGTPAEIAAAEAAAAVLNSKKVRKRRENTGKKVPAESAAEAARQMFESKRLGSKVNFSVLEKLFDGKEEEQEPKRLKVDPDEGNVQEAEPQVGGEGEEEGEEEETGEAAQEEEYYEEY